MLKEVKLFIHQQRSKNRLMKSFKKDLETYNRLASEAKLNLAQKDHLYPCLYDATDQTLIDPTYFYQDSWAFERIVKNKPSSHIDIGSQHKFVALLSKVVNLTMVDIRPLSLEMESIKFSKGSILDLPYEDGSIESVSSLCVVEHIGLGRYGDPLDPNGSEKAIKEITRILKPHGKFYFSVPVSNKEIIAFNAGRIFEHDKLLKDLSFDFQIIDKAYIHGPKLIDQFIPDDRFGTTILLELKKL